METDNFLPKENTNLIQDMNSKIKHLGEGNKNIVEFWQETINIIKKPYCKPPKHKTMLEF